jgi:hypothetical protein
LADTLQSVEKEKSLSFCNVGANCVRPRATTGRPYKDDFLSASKTCFMEGVPYDSFFFTK